MNDFYYNRDQYSMNVYYNDRFLLRKWFNIQWMSTKMIDFYYKSDSIFNECLLKWTIFTIKVINIQ